ncbi:MAG: ATPase [Paramuribaculum sp.]|nr:ATPase [Paramuribaculum sp.]
MKLIVDSGSTKALWIALDDNGKAGRFETPGMNPALMSEADILSGVVDRIPAPLIGGSVSEIWFYAAGCRSGRESDAICAALESVWRSAHTFAGSDMLGAARAVCGNSAGVAAILGTGSNCAVYSPEQGIVASTPPLGYILGDEGSGADIGKAIVNSALKGLWSRALSEKFLMDNNLTQGDIINRVYRCTEPNRFLASFALWAKQNISEPEVSSLITGRFIAFIERNIKPMPQADGLPAGFVGSVAGGFEPQLREACTLCGVEVRSIAKSPEEGLINYHKTK